MSVINQMLKDLDKRQYEQAQGRTNAPQVVISENSGNKWLLVGLVISLIVALAIIGWQYTKFSERSTEQVLLSKPTEQAQQTLAAQSKTTPEESDFKSAKPVNHNTQVLNKGVTVASDANESQNQPNYVKTSSNSLAPELAPESISAQSQRAKTPVNKEQTQQFNTNNTAQLTEAVRNEAAIIEPESKLSISRKQLSAKELVAVKLKQAQQAIEQQQIEKAEALFEEVLLVDEMQHQARKQLAALWFGRQDYNAAVNLLSQGLAIDSNNADFRLMMARIYLGQGFNQQAFDVLTQANANNNVEYQIMLASVAQQLNAYPSAQQAYQRLTQLAPNVGRWWLGLAVAFDSDGKFEQAIESYQKALQQSDLSLSSIEFIKSRLNELGE